LHRLSILTNAHKDYIGPTFVGSHFHIIRDYIRWIMQKCIFWWWF
jgi:hypothetical protein